MALRPMMRGLLAWRVGILLLAASSASAQTLPVKSILLQGGSCAGSAAQVDFVQGVYCGRGARATAFTSLPGAAFGNSTGGYAQTSAGVLKSFAANTPRATDQGLLVETASTNLQTWSQDFTNATWTKSGVTVIANVATAPDGTATANKLTEDASNGQHIVGGNVGQTSGSVYTNSVFVKAAERSYAMVRTSFSSPDSGFVVNLTTGAISSAFGTLITSSSVQALAAGWFRISLTYVDNNIRGSVVVAPALNATTYSYAGDGASGIYAWGAQLEQASSPSSYIPTTSAAATRAADTASITYSPNGSAGTVTYGAGSSTSVSPASPINFGASSGGAWVGGYFKTLAVSP